MSGGPQLSDPVAPGCDKGSPLHRGTPCLGAPPSRGGRLGKAVLRGALRSGAGAVARSGPHPERALPGHRPRGSPVPVLSGPGRAAALRSRPPPGGSPLPPDA